MTKENTIYYWLLMAEKKLWSYVTLTSHKAAGPGGQKVNKTMTAVRLTFQPNGLISQCKKYRTQKENKVSAFRKLRRNMALFCKRLPEPKVVKIINPYLQNGLKINEKNPDLALVYAALSGAFSHFQGDYRKVADYFNISSSRLNRFLLDQKPLLNSIRKNTPYGQWFDKIH